jgi:Na+-transporting methylmalonyl-CoA/oxaloacetate decarboxylase gamma subunit
MGVRVTPGPAEPSEDHALSEAVRARTAEELRAVREVASNWRTALAAMLTLVTAVSVVRGRDSIAGLTQGARVLVGVLLLLAVVTACVGAFLSSRSAFGIPKEEQAVQRLTDLVAAERARVHRAVRDLRVAIALTFVTLALIVASVGVVWYGPTA